MIGQDEILKKVKPNGLYLIIGPKGSGKTTLAKEIILKFICEQGTGCGKCRSCRLFLSGNYPDFHLLEGGKIEEVRELISKIHTKPLYYKHYILLDNIDKMTIPAQNALLKTLEEPISPTLFIATGTIPKNILHTIVSRSIKLSPQLLPQSIILEELKKKFQEENIEFLEKASEYAEGSLGYAFDMVEKKDFYQMLFECIENIEENNFYTTASYLAEEYKDEVLVILNFFEKYLRNMMRHIIENEKDTSRDTKPIYEIVRDIEKYKKQLSNNINLTMMYQNIIIKMQKLFSE